MDYLRASSYFKKIMLNTILTEIQFPIKASMLLTATAFFDLGLQQMY